MWKIFVLLFLFLCDSVVFSQNSASLLYSATSPANGNLGSRIFCDIQSAPSSGTTSTDFCFAYSSSGNGKLVAFSGSPIPITTVDGPASGFASTQDSVFVGNGFLMVGAPSSNSAYVYSLSGGNINLVYTLSGASGDGFGSAVYATSSLFIVGAPNANSNRGYVRVYSGSGSLLYQLNGTTSGDLFGTAVGFVALPPTSPIGPYVVVGAPGVSSSRGQVSFFLSSSGAFNISVNGYSAGDLFGSRFYYSYDLELLVYGKGYNSFAGGVFAISLNSVNSINSTSSWRNYTGTTANENFGATFGYNNGFYVFGSPNYGGNKGRVTKFDSPSGTSTFDGSNSNDYFGIAVAASTDYQKKGVSGTLRSFMIGARGVSSNNGAVYVCDLFASNLGNCQTIAGSSGNQFGSVLTRVGSDFFVGAPQDDSGNGKVFKYSLSGASTLSSFLFF